VSESQPRAPGQEAWLGYTNETGWFWLPTGGGRSFGRVDESEGLYGAAGLGVQDAPADQLFGEIGR
jgi:hypothetical protein